MKERRSKMRKLLIIPLVLSAVSICEASLIFTINGEPQPAEITLQTSETIELDLELTPGHICSGFALRYELSNNQAELIADDVVLPSWPPDYRIQIVPLGVEIVWYDFMSPPIEGPAVLIQGLILHCVVYGPVDLTISTFDGGTMIDGQTLPDGVLHTLTIHQVPEPTAILLLATGALILRRRR
jgi:hypothetical protein